MSLMQEFKAFAFKGNVIDLAVGIVIGVAFGKIVSSFVTNIIMPPIGFITGGVDFSNLKIVLKQAQFDSAGKVISPETAIGYGAFINTIIEFVIIALAIFLMVKLINKMRKNEEAAAPTKEVQLLTEIRDSLRK